MVPRVLDVSQRFPSEIVSQKLNVPQRQSTILADSVTLLKKEVGDSSHYEGNNKRLLASSLADCLL